MDLYHSSLERNSAIADAIRAVESQRESAGQSRSTEDLRNRDALFELLDQMSPDIFQAVKQKAESGGRELYLGTVLGYDQAVDRIFDYGGGRCNARLFNEWLFARDLSHIFSATDMKLKW